MRNNWQVKKLSELCDSFSDGDWIEKKDQSLEGIRLIQTGNIGNSIFKDKENKARYISQATFDKLQCTEVLPDDCLISRLPKPVGRACIIPDTNERMVTAVDCTIVRFKKNIISKWFIYYSLSINYQNQIDHQITGTTRERISRKDLGMINIKYPDSLEEQHHIVKILDEVFEKVEKAKENVEKNLQNSRELFESFAQVAFKDTGNWSHKKLGEVCDLYQGLAINAKTKHLLVEKSDLPLLRIKDLKNNTVEQYVDPSNYPKNSLVDESDLIYTRTGQIGLVFTGKKGILHNNSFKIEPKNELSKEYLFLWLQNPDFKSKIIALASRAAQPDITHVLFKQQIIVIPSLFEQKTIVKKLNALSEQTKKLEMIYQQKLATWKS